VSIKTGRGSSQVKLDPGQFIFGRKSASEELRVPGTTLARRMSRLEKSGNVVMQPGTHFSIVSIANWEVFQSDDPEGGQATGQACVRQRSGNGQACVTNKKEEKEKKGEEEKELVCASAPAELLELIDVWNGLGKGIVRPGNGARRDPPAKAVLQCWKRIQADQEASAPFENIPALRAAIRNAKFCHGKGWFTLPWLFGKNKNHEWNAVKLINGGHDDANGSGAGRSSQFGRRGGGNQADSPARIRNRS